MRILQVTGAYPPTIGGGPSIARDITSYLRDRGHHVSVVTTDPGDGDLGDSDVYRAPAKRIAGAPVAPTFPRLLHRVADQVDPGIIHSYYPLPFYPDVAAAYASTKNIPFVLTCFGAWESSFDSVIGTLGFAYNNTLLRGTLRLTDAAHTLSPGVLTDIDTYDGYEELFRVIPPGVRVTGFDPDRVEASPPFTRGDADHVLLFVGVFRRYKGLDTLIRSFDRLQEELDVKLALVGEGPEEGAVRDAVSRRGLTDDVELLGHVSKGELLAAYAEADAFVLPSPNIRESFGVVVSEALAMGTPVVATAKSGSGHFLSEHDIGTIVEPDDPESLADGIRWLLTDRNRYQSEASAAREFAVTTLSWERLVDEYIDLYESVLS